MSNTLCIFYLIDILRHLFANENTGLPTMQNTHHGKSRVIHPTFNQLRMPVDP